MNQHLRMQGLFTAICFAALLAFVSLRSNSAHVGPPFPILSDQPVPGYAMSIWADPDIGEALFYVVLEPEKSNTAPSVSQIEFWVEPVNGRLARKAYPVNQQKARGHLRHVATPQFDTQEFWKVGVVIKLADGSTHPFVAQVESTPPGLGPWDMLVYIFPFVLFGGLWAVVFVRKARIKAAKRRNAQAAPEIAGASPNVYHEAAR